jgi:hypothetical protein
VRSNEKPTNFWLVEFFSLMKVYHPKQSLRALYYGMRWRARRLLRMKEKPNTSVIASGVEKAIERHERVCRTLLRAIHDPALLKGAIVAEIGPGDCLAAADMMLGLGAKHIHLIDYHPIPVNGIQLEILTKLATDATLPNQVDILTADPIPHLRMDKATAHVGLLEDIGIPEPVDLIYSFDVLEHVEDLGGFFGWCGRMTKPQGYQIHKFDLSGHEFFEDPIPPLDFQTHPTWLFNLIFPKFRRAAGHFADEIFNSLTAHGFEIVDIAVLRKADTAYLNRIWPDLRPEAKVRPLNILALLDVVVCARRTK